MQPEQFPKPLKDYLQQQQAKEEAERKQREIEKSTCKVLHSPGLAKLSQT